MPNYATRIEQGGNTLQTFGNIGTTRRRFCSICGQVWHVTPLWTARLERALLRRDRIGAGRETLRRRGPNAG